MPAVPDRVDVAVIGGGPAGSCAANLLARRGLQVAVLERERFPRAHVGESLLPASLPILEELGVLDAVRAEGFVEKWGATMVWGREPEPWSWYFRETNPANPHAYQVWRPRFDQILLQGAAARGADVHEGAAVREVRFEGERATGVRFRDPAGRERTLGARFVVDASGQSALLSRRLRLRRWDAFFRNWAVYAYARGGERLPQPDSGNIFIESYADGWIWQIPLRGGWTSVGAVVDRERAREGLRQGGAEAFFRRQLEAAPHAARMLADARFEASPALVRDWSYRSRRTAGPGFVLAGDAACFVDPLFSSGVHLALSSGVLAAAYVAGALSDESLAGPAGEVYQKLYYTQYDHFHALAKLFYSGNRTAESYFWEARRLLAEEESFSPRHAFVRALAGQPPAGYERSVLGRGELPDGFATGVRELEDDRGRRRRRLEGADLSAAVPVLADGAGVERRPVLGDGEFVWGHAIRAASRAEETACSPLVALLVSGIDGSRTLDEIRAGLARGRSPDEREAIARHVERAARVLYLDGVIESLGNA
ncbi:MAG: tryptophan 7-halogenase [Proteobacteria bacterium]|nr:tryptophan 7-halogenase [Pseudomonadota bacterium]